MLDQLSKIVLTVIGALVLLVIIAVLVVSCRQSSAGDEVTATIVVPTPFILASPTPLLPSPTPPPTGLIATPPSVIPTLPADTTAPPGTSPGLIAGTTVEHLVFRGEWLLQIARCYGTSYALVHDANRLPDPDFILPGQSIIVPNIGSVGRIIGPPCVVAYTVQAGDTWESLAARYGTTTAILRRANPGGLSVGSQIWVPRV